jgi:hypothetical protein
MRQVIIGAFTSYILRIKLKLAWGAMNENRLLSSGYLNASYETFSARARREYFGLRDWDLG